MLRKLSSKICLVYALYIFVALFVLVFVFSASSAEAYTSPGKPLGYVSDFAHVLGPEDVANIDANLSQFEASTTDQLAVVTVSSLGGDTIENYTNSLFREWGIGQKSKNNGVLLLIAINDRKMRIEVGYGLEGDLTDLQSSKIINNVIAPFFKTGDYSSGIKAGVNTIEQTIVGDTSVLDSVDSSSSNSSNTNDKGGTIVGIIYFSLIFISWLGAILARSRSWWLGGVLGGIAGAIVGYILNSLFDAILLAVVLAILGLLFDYFVSNTYQKRKSSGAIIPWWIGGGRWGGGSGFGGGGFGGFGGGSSGGGGASGGW